MNHIECNKEGRTKLGAMILRKLGVLPEYIADFESRNQVCRSEEPYGFAYYVDTEEQAIIDKMEQSGHTVYAVIKGRYVIGQVDIMDATTYLYVSNDEVNRFNHNIDAAADPLDGIVEVYDPDKKYYYVMANVYGFEQEYGGVIIAPKRGGLTRVG